MRLYFLLDDKKQSYYLDGFGDLKISNIPKPIAYENVIEIIEKTIGRVELMVMENGKDGVFRKVFSRSIN